MSCVESLPVRLHRTSNLGVDEGREADSDRVDPEDGDVLFYTAVGDDVSVSQRLRERGQAIHRDGDSHQNAHAA